MSPVDGPNGDGARDSQDSPTSREIVAFQLFESLIHHLIEKGVLTRNDALSIVQTVAQVQRGTIEEWQPGEASSDETIGILRRIYSSFELLRTRPAASHPFDRDNVLQLRPPLHGDSPEFPRED